MEPKEIPLQGGRTTGAVVRVGDTVRRLATPNSDFVRRLLLHLEMRGFGGSPSFLGTDESDRDVFSYIDGDVPADLSFYEDSIITDVARLIRRYHDLTAELLACPAAQAAGFEVVCHNDLSPCNFVFRLRRPAAIIDFDTAAPGTRVHDLAYAAWLWLDVGSADIDPAEQRRRLPLFLDAYGFNELSLCELSTNMLACQSVVVAQGIKTGDDDTRRWAESCRSWTRRNINALI